ncbi:MAG: hypothetical protein R3310_05845, partial [Candidatus Competibacteraceae bacterium]|nr:hypothetical protein [Candidatus Competibacteraceae bacterium]
MQAGIIKQFVERLNERWKDLQGGLDREQDLAGVEGELLEMVKEFYGQLIKALIEEWQSRPGRREELQRLGGSLGRRLKEDRVVRLQ